MLALIDADILRYEVGSVGQDKDGNVKSFDFVKDVFDERIRTIVDGSGATDFRLFLTGDARTLRIHSRTGDVAARYEPNFREALATGKVYKGTRVKDKPFHWLNLTAYILAQGLSSDGRVSVSNGCEADDQIAITARQMDRGSSIICSRDKDLRMVPGLHYGWECGKQPEFGPVEYDDLGTIELVRSKSGNKIRGGGFKFFCSQLLTGDVVDNIGGAKGIGPVAAYEILKDCTTERGCFSAVRDTYYGLDSERWKELLTEQCSLLWIVRELNEDGSLKHFNIEEWL